MSRRIIYLNQSPCYNCKCKKRCNKKIRKQFSLNIIRDNIFANADFDYHDCGIWIALNAPDMVEVSDE